MNSHGGGWPPFVLKQAMAPAKGQKHQRKMIRSDGIPAGKCCDERSRRAVLNVSTKSSSTDIQDLAVKAMPFAACPDNTGVFSSLSLTLYNSLLRFSLLRHSNKKDWPNRIAPRPLLYAIYGRLTICVWSNC